MSFTRTVPAAVPSLFHSSTACTPSFAAKYAVDPIAAVHDGSEDAVPGLMSRIICGDSDGVTRSSTASSTRGRRAPARETGRVGLALRSELHQRSQNELFMR